MIWSPWACAAALYVIFRLWYDNWRGRLSPDEIDLYLRRAAAAGESRVDGLAINDTAIIREFLEQDDGREFVMLNLVRVAPGKVPHPVSGMPTSGKDLLALYSSPFIAALIRRGGHPAIVARKVGGYVDAWGVAPDPGWTIMGYMRYRSRRDLMALATDPRFRDIHQFKLAGIAQTFSFPTQPWLRLFIGPRAWLALVLALTAALAEIVMLLRQ